MTPQIEGEMNPKPNLYGIYRNMKHVQLLRVELTDRQRDRQNDRETKRKKDRHIHTEIQIDIQIQKEREGDRQ